MFDFVGVYYRVNSVNIDYIGCILDIEDHVSTHVNKDVQSVIVLLEDVATYSCLYSVETVKTLTKRINNEH